MTGIISKIREQQRLLDWPNARSFGGLVVLAISICSGHLDAQKRVSPVVAFRIVEAQVQTGRRVVGTVMPLKTSTIGSATDGRVYEYLIEHGSFVNKDQPLAKLRTETLEIELAAAEAELSLYQQQLNELKNGSRPEEIAEAKAKMLGAESAMKNSAIKLERTNSLAVSGAASDTALDNARELAQFTKHAFEASKAMLERVQEGPRVERIAQAQAQVELQKQRVLLIEDRIRKHTIISPFDGFVAEEFTEIGAWITRGDPIARVIYLNEVEIQVPAIAEYAIQLRQGDPIRVEFPELPRKVFTGTVARIVPFAETRARTFPVYIRMQNEFSHGVPMLMSGMLARVELPTGPRRPMTLAPKDALVLNDDNRYLYVVEADEEQRGEENTDQLEGIVRRIPVELGVASGGLIQVIGAVRSGQLVVSLGNERLGDGDRVVVTSVITRESDQNTKETTTALKSR